MLTYAYSFYKYKDDYQVYLSKERTIFEVAIFSTVYFRKYFIFSIQFAFIFQCILYTCIYVLNLFYLFYLLQYTVITGPTCDRFRTLCGYKVMVLTKKIMMKAFNFFR